MIRKDNNGRRVLISKTLRKVWKDIPVGKEFHGWELRNMCVALEPDLTGVYVDTFLRRLREYYNGCYELVSRSESLYKKIEEKQSSFVTEEELAKYRKLKQQSFDFGEM